MTKEQKFFRCAHCGNIVGMIEDAGVPIMCCGEKMQELRANTSDGAAEKHVPEVRVDGQNVNVDVSSVAHPMQDEHHIQWVYLQTEHGGQRKSLCPSDPPKAQFCLTPDDKAVAAFAYCNLHGLWKSNA